MGYCTLPGISYICTTIGYVCSTAGAYPLHTFHTGGDSSRFRKLFRGTQRMALRPLIAGAERLIGPSRWEVEFFQERLHLPHTKFVVIPNGSYHLPVQVKRDGEKKETAPLIVSVGRL